MLAVALILIFVLPTLADLASTGDSVTASIRATRSFTFLVFLLIGWVGTLAANQGGSARPA